MAEEERSGKGQIRIGRGQQLKEAHEATQGQYLGVEENRPKSGG